MQKKHTAVMSVEALAQSPGGETVYMVRIGQNIGQKGTKTPAVLVVANPAGHLPMTSEGALGLIERLLADPGSYKDLNWYLVPSLNPDAHRRYFAAQKGLSRLNDRPVNADRDDREGEDPADDLNGDGLITQMRVVDPEGQWLPVEGEPRLMRRADPSKGERGRYALYPEGKDNDGDGQTNEDGPGGVNVAVNFPHLFTQFKPEAGEWAGSEAEAFELIRFVSEHREIAMSLVLGETNFCFQPPQGGRRNSVDYSRITVPEFIGKRFGFDTNRTYTMQEIMAEAQKMAPPGMELTESMVASFLGLGAVVNPLGEDMQYYEKISEQYKEFLKKANLPVERFDPRKDQDGAFELWAYYHMGLPSFTLDLWSVPKPPKKEEKGDAAMTPDKLAVMSNEDFLALGEEKIDAFLKASGAPKQFGAAMVMKMVKDGQMNTKRMAEMMKQMGGGPAKGDGPKADPVEEALLKYSDEKLAGKGFLPWVKVKHPEFAEVEVGGFAPYIDQNPPVDQVKSLLDAQLPWIGELVKHRARLAILKTEVKPVGGGLYRLSAWVENQGLIPYPTAMGGRNQRTTPVIVSLDGQEIEFMSGHKRERINAVKGHGTAKVEWLIRVKAPQNVTLKMTSDYAGGDAKTVRVGGES